LADITALAFGLKANPDFACAESVVLPAAQCPPLNREEISVMKLNAKSAILGLAAAALLASAATAQQRVLKYYADYDPARSPQWKS
jgi:hypothetical protein